MDINILKQKLTDYLSQKFNDNSGWFRQGKFTPVQQISDKAQKDIQSLTDNTGLVRANKFGVPTLTPLKALGDFSYKGGPTVREAFNQLPQQAQQDWGNAGLVTNNQLLQKFAPKTIKPLSTAVKIGPAAYMNAMSKGVTTFSRDTTPMQKVWDLLGVYGANNPAYAARNLVGGPLGVVFKGVENKFMQEGEPKPFFNDWQQGWQQGQEFQYHSAPINQATSYLVNQFAQAVPFLQKFTDVALSKSGITTTDGVKQAVGKWLSQAGKRLLRNSILETVVETPIWASMTKTDQETYLDAIQREAVQNLIQNTGMSLLNSTMDTRQLTPIFKNSIDTAVNNYMKNLGSPESLARQAGYIGLGGETINGTIRTNMFNSAIETYYSTKSTPEQKINALDTIRKIAGDVYSKKEIARLSIGKNADPENLITAVGDKLKLDVETNRGYKEPFTIKNLLANKELQRGGMDLTDKTKGFPQTPNQPIKTGGVSQISPESKGITPEVKVKTDIVPQKEQNQILQQKIESSKLTKQELQNSGLSAKETSKIQQSSSNRSITQKGKLNLKNLNLSEDEKIGINTIQESVPITIISNKSVVDQSKLTTGRKTAMTDEQMQKLLAQQLNTRQEVVSLQNQYTKLKKSGASDAELLALKNQIIDQSRIAQQQGTFAGRLLQSQNIMANEMATPEQRIYALLDNAGIDKQKYIKDAINVDFNNAKQVVDFYRKYVPPKFSEVLTEIRYTNMLSSPLTHVINTFTNILQSAIVKPIEKTVTGQLDWIKSKITGSERKYYASQGIDYTKGYYKSLPQAVKKFKDTVTGINVYLKPDLERIPTGSKGLLKAYTTPLRVLEASDQFFRTLVASGEEKSLGRFRLTDAQIAKRAADSAEYTLFRQQFDPDGKLGQGYVLRVWDKWNSAIQMLRRLPGGKWIVPFLQTPTNILKQGVEYSPLGIVTLPGSKNKTEQLAKALIGTVVFTTTYSLADVGQITWSTPTNTKDRELFYAAGMQPYSIKIGNKWVSYSKLGPLSYPMAMAGALKWAERNNPDNNFFENLMVAMPQMMVFFGDQSYVSQLGDTIDSLTSGYNQVEKSIKNTTSNLLSQLVPYRSFQGWLTRMIDPVYRKPETIKENLMSQVPGLSTNVPAYTDIYNNESKRDLPLLNAFSPARISVEKPLEKSMYNVQEQYRINKNKENKLKKEFEETGKISGLNDTGYGADKIIYVDENDGVKTLDLSKYDDIANLPDDNKYNSAIKESKQYSEATKIMDNASLTAEQQQTALDRLGIDKDKASYYQVANDNDNLKTMFVLDAINKVKTQGGGFADVIQLLANQRTEVNGKMIASNGVIDNLVDEGILTKAQATELKKYKYENGKLVPKSKTGTKVKKISVTLRKMSSPARLSSSKPKKLTVPKKTYKKIKPIKLKVLKVA